MVCTTTAVPERRAITAAGPVRCGAVMTASCTVVAMAANYRSWTVADLA